MQNIETYKIHVTAKTNFVVEWLRVVGVQEHQIITGTIFAKTLLIPELGKCGSPAPQQIMWLQEKINSYLPDNQQDKHVLIVKRTKRRKQSNWADILNVAKKISTNVVIHDDSDLPSVQQQLKNFRNAHTVIAPHGAGLVNILASRPNTKVIEFMDPNNMNLCYARLAYILGLKYNAIELKSSINHVSQILQRKSSNNFKIHIITMNRAKSLQRLLDSLKKADYAGDRVEIYIHIDKSDDNRDCIKVAESFDFSHGKVTIEVAEQNNGLRNAWFRAWYPKENERAIILEDDIEVSPQWYFWLNKAWQAYGERDDLAGISLQRQTLVPQKPRKQMEIVNNHKPFLYRLVGSIGFSPHWKQWRAFLNWIHSVDTTTVDVKTPGLITSDWLDNLDRRHMWTQYFIWFCKQHDLYTLYVNLPEQKTLAAHMREKGKHFDKTEGRDFALATQVELKFPTVLVKYGWDGHRNEVYDSENVFSIAKTIEQKYGFVFLMFLNDAYLEMTKSFICHHPTLLKQTIFLTTGSHLTEQLHAWNPDIFVHAQLYSNNKKVSYGTYEYFRLTVERLQFQNELIQNGVNVFVIEADATWNSLNIIEVIRNAFMEHEIVSADDHFKLISAGFLGVRSTDKTRTFFQQYVDAYSKKLEPYRTRSGQIGDIGEQHTMTPLLKKLGIQVHWLSQCESANGKWYRQTNPDCPLPMVIQNNWIVGNSAKIKRAKENKQWFLDEKGQCKKGNELETIGASQVHSIAGMGWVGTDPTKIKNSFSSLKTCQLIFSGFSLSPSKAIQFIGNKEKVLSNSIFVCETFFCSGINGGTNGHEGTITNMHGYMAALGNPKNEIMMDVGSNLGFYSLLDSKFGYRTMTFDPSTSCLYATQKLSRINQLSEKIVLNNVGVGYEPQNLQNSNSGCHINNHPTTTGGSGVKVLVRKLDELVTDMDGSNLLTDNRIVRLLKIDVEGGETKIVQGMNNLMQSGKVLNLIVELTPIHWNQAGLKKFSPMAAEHFAEMTTVHGYDAYMLYIQKPRHPPPSLSHIVSRVTKDHPINTYMKENNVDVEKYGIKIKNTGCEGSPFWKIHDMKKYILDYCVDWVGTAYPPSKGSCGNIWFTKSSSWTRDLIGQPEDNPIVNKLPSNLPCVDEPKKTGCHDDRRRATTIGVIHDTNDALF